MKKIVGILAAAAVLATSVFAADVSAKVELDGKLFNYDGDSKAVSALNVDKPSAQHWNPALSTSVSGDNAGASFVVMSGDNEKFGGWNEGKALAGRNWQIWLKPTDSLKFTIGKIDANLNQEQITWSGTKINTDSNGFGVNLGIDAVSIDVLFTPGLGANWFSKEDGKDAVIGQTTVKVAYGADFGNIGLWFQGNETFKKNTIAVGYNNNFDGIFAFVNAGATIANKDVNQGKNDYIDIRVEAFAKGNADAFGWAVWVPFNYITDDTWKKDDSNAIVVDQKKGAYVGSIVELTYALDGATGYFRFNDGNFLADKFAAEFRLGAKGSVGAAGWNIWAQINAAEKTSFSVPFEFSYSF